MNIDELVWFVNRMKYLKSYLFNEPVSMLCLNMPQRYHSKSLTPLRLEKIGVLLLFIFLLRLITANHSIYAESSSPKFQLSYKNNLITISAQDADLKNVLSNLADKTNISVGFPGSLEKKVTINKMRISLREALQRLLKGLNYVIIYSGSGENQSVVSNVLIYQKSKKTNRLRVNESRITNRIRAYERQIESLQNNLSKIDENSRRGKGYKRRIELIEKTIERLKRQSY